jgi:hypothetical protein
MQIILYETKYMTQIAADIFSRKYPYSESGTAWIKDAFDDSCRATVL